MAVAAALPWSPYFTANEKLAHRVYQRNTDVLREDLIHLQSQWTGQVLLVAGDQECIL